MPKVDKDVMMQALFESLFVAALLEENPDPSDQEIKIYIADCLLGTTDLKEKEALESLTLEKIHQAIQDHKRISAIFSLPIEEKSEGD